MAHRFYIRTVGIKKSRLSGAVALLLVAATLCGCRVPPAVHAGDAHVLGATEVIHLTDAGIDFRAIIDTGAYRTSIHALDIRIQDPAPRMRDNIGRRVEFLVVNEAGRSRRISSTISDAEPVRTSHGTEWRYVVPLRLRWRDVEKEVQVNLRDRTPMAYKLLVGRDWIRGDFLVDVERNAVD
jgi:hypothetical protein